MRDTVEAHSEDVQSDVTDSGDIAADAATAATTVTESGFAALGLRPELLNRAVKSNAWRLPARS